MKHFIGANGSLYANPVLLHTTPIKTTGLYAETAILHTDAADGRTRSEKKAAEAAFYVPRAGIEPARL